MKTRLDGLEATLSERVSKEVDGAFDRLNQKLATALTENLDAKWKPVGESVETFARSSHQLTKDLSDTYRVATQTRLLLNENSRRMIDLGRDLVALEESLKLALTKALEEGLQSLEDRIASLENRLGAGEGAAEGHATPEPPGSGLDRAAARCSFLRGIPATAASSSAPDSPTPIARGSWSRRG